MSVPATAAIVGDPPAWAELSAEYDDVHGLWGGRRAQVSGGGAVAVQVLPVPAHEERRELALTPAEARAFFQRFLDCDFAALEVPMPERLAPDTGQVRLTLRGPGGAATVAKFDHTPPHAGFDSLRAAFDEIFRRAGAASQGG